MPKTRSVNKEKQKELRNKALKLTFKVAAIGLLANAVYQQYAPEFIKSIGERLAHKAKEAFVYPYIPSIFHADSVYSFDESDKIVAATDPNITIEHHDLISVYNPTDHWIKQWMSVMGEHKFLMQNENNSDLYRRWCRQFDDLRGKSLKEKAEGVDEIIDNYVAYTSDDSNYGTRDLFASPLETIERKRGDCDDYAILKYFALRHLDVPTEKLFVAIVDTDNDGEIDHATILVDTNESTVMGILWTGLTGGTADRNLEVIDNHEMIDGSDVYGFTAELKELGYSIHYLMNENGIWTIPENIQTASPANRSGTVNSNKPVGLGL